MTYSIFNRRLIFKTKLIIIPKVFQKLILDQIIKIVLALSKTAVSGIKVKRTVDIIKLGNLLIRIQRRGKLGKDGGLSEIIKIIKDKTTQEVWHIVIRGNEIIHKHLKYKK